MESKLEHQPSKKFKSCHWSLGLKASIQDPNLLVESDELITIIKDKYPKARHHYLVLPKDNIPNLKALTKDHVALLEHMHRKAEDLVNRIDSQSKFRIGYHAVPSMSHLHLHVISQDFDSPCLKTKVHWNSFTTRYFIESKDIIKQLKTEGSVQLVDPETAKELLKQPLRCHICRKELPTIPKLKDHVLVHVNKRLCDS